MGDGVEGDWHAQYIQKNNPSLIFKPGFPGGPVVKNPPAMQEKGVQSLGQENPLEKKWQPILVFLPGKSQGQRSLAGNSKKSCKASDTTERLNNKQTI